MEYPQHLCVVSNNELFHEQVSRSFASSFMSVRRVQDWEVLLASPDLQQVCLLIDSDLAAGESASYARSVWEWLATRPIQILIVSRPLHVAVQAGRNPLYDVLVKRADILLDKPVEMDQLSFALHSVMRKNRGRLSPSGAAESGRKAVDDRKLWQFDPVAMVLIPPEGESFPLSASEARLIAMLITKDPEPVRREDLIELFGISSPNIRRIDTTVYRLRHKIEQNTGYQSPFSTVHGVGYRNESLSATVPLSF